MAVAKCLCDIFKFGRTYEVGNHWISIGLRAVFAY